MRGTISLPSLGPMGCPFFGLSLAFPFVFVVMVSTIDFLLDFLDLLYIYLGSNYLFLVIASSFITMIVVTSLDAKFMLSFDR